MADYRLTTSIPELGSAPLPSSSVGEYINQQAANSLQSGNVESQRNLFNPTQNFSRDNTPAVTAAPNPLDSLNSTVSSVQASNQRLSEYAAQGAAVRKRQQEEAARTAASAQAAQQQSPTYSNTYSVPVGVTGNRAAALKEASTYLGNRYVLGGTTHSGIDCSGLVMMVYNKMGYNISRHSATWQRDNIPGVRTNDLNSLRPGDLVAWKDGSHIAIYAGNGEIIEAANEQRGTLRRKLWANPSAVIGIKLRFPGE